MKDNLYCHQYLPKYVPNPFSTFGPLPNNMLIRSRPVAGGHCGFGASIYGPLPLPPAPPAIRHFEPPDPGAEEPVLVRRNSAKSRAKSVDDSSYNDKWDRYTKKSKKSSSYHNTCFEQPWIPSPAQTSKKFKSTQTSSQKSYPLCMLCDRDYGYFEENGDWCVAGEEDNADYLFKKFTKNAERYFVI